MVIVPVVIVAMLPRMIRMSALNNHWWTTVIVAVIVSLGVV